MSLASGLLDNGISLATLQAHFDALDRQQLRIHLTFDAQVRPGNRRVYYRPGGAFPDVSDVRHELQLSLESSVLDFTVKKGKLRGQQVGVILTDRFLKPEELTRFGLTVDVLSSYLPLLVRYMETHKTLAFEDMPGAGMSDGSGGTYRGAHLLFRNPRGVWQLSHFSPGLGPTGHQEGSTPAEALHQWGDLTRARPDDGEALRRVMAAPDVLGAIGARLRTHAPIPDVALDYAMRKLAGKIRRCGITREALRAGMAVETEHADVTHNAIEKTARIAVAHLCESPRYYVELARMERRLAR